MDAFFASIEQLDNPELRGKPVVVGSPAERGVIAAASYEARKYGVRSAMPSTIAMRLCPGLIFVNHHMRRYREVSSMIFSVFYNHSPLVEALSVDEAFLDVTASTGSFADAVVMAGAIKEDIKNKTGLTSSAGISVNKFLAKLASDINKPDGIFAISEPEVDKFLASLPISSFYGIGRITAEKMHRFGIHDGADLRKAGLDFLSRNFGKAGRFYYDISRGVDDRPVEPGKERKSIGAELTFDSDLTTSFQVIAELYKIERELWSRVEKEGKTGRTVTLKIKFDDFAQLTRSHTSETKITEFSELHALVTGLRETIDLKRKRIRLMGVSVSNLDDDGVTYEQLELWNKR